MDKQPWNEERDRPIQKAALEKWLKDNPNHVVSTPEEWKKMPVPYGFRRIKKKRWSAPKFK